MNWLVSLLAVTSANPNMFIVVVIGRRVLIAVVDQLGHKKKKKQQVVQILKTMCSICASKGSKSRELNNLFCCKQKYFVPQASKSKN